MLPCKSGCAACAARVVCVCRVAPYLPGGVGGVAEQGGHKGGGTGAAEASRAAGVAGAVELEGRAPARRTVERLNRRYTIVNVRVYLIVKAHDCYCPLASYC